MRASIARAHDAASAVDAEALFKVAAELGIAELAVQAEHGKRVISGTARYQIDRDRFFEAVKQLDGWESGVVVDIVVEHTDIRGLHTVEPGETLASIAARYLGEAGDEMTIFEANRDRMNDPDQISPGQQLVIPRR